MYRWLVRKIKPKIIVIYPIKQRPYLWELRHPKLGQKKIFLLLFTSQS